MNKERIMTIVNWLENGAVHVTPEGLVYGFEMEAWDDRIKTEYEDPNPEFPEHCGSAMCIGGAAEQFFNGKGPKREAAELLGLDNDIATDLFYPWTADWYNKTSRPDLTPMYMAGVLRRLLDTGKLIG